MVEENLGYVKRDATQEGEEEKPLEVLEY